MQYLTITKDMSLSELSEIVGERNVDYVLNANGLDRTVDVGDEFYSRTVEDIPVDYQTKMNILNQFVGDSDLYEKAALGSEKDWQTLSQYNCFTDAIKIPIEVEIPQSEGVLGNLEPISDSIHYSCMEALKSSNSIDPTVFASYNRAVSSSDVGLVVNGVEVSSEPFHWFLIPWGAVCLYSSIDGDMLYFPVYPESISDGVSANYDEMGEMLYQYEPWKVYKSSGPREITFNFKFHRDMWTGDHRDGKANELVRGCEANCYANYDGSLVTAPMVTMYIEGENYITGVMTSCKVEWHGPIGLDGFYLFCDLSLTIVEVSPEPLNYYSVRSKGLIG